MILGLWKYGGSGEHSFDQSNWYANFAGRLLHVGSKVTEMTHRERKARIMARRGRENTKLVGMAGGQYYGGEYDNG